MVILYKWSQWMIRVAQIRASNVSVPSYNSYLVNRVEKLENVFSNNFFEF